MARRDAFLRVPIADVGSRTLIPLATNTNKLMTTNSARLATNPPAVPQYVEVFCDQYTYTSNFLVFRDHVRGKLYEGETARGSIACAFLGLRFSNQLETALASGKVAIEQFALFGASSGSISRKGECEQLHVKMSP